jgi:DNA-binding Lrp family transcriptional regulator
VKHDNLNVCILIKTVPVKVYNIVDQLKKINEVKKCYITYGRFDIAAFAEVMAYEKARRLSAKVNELEGVRSTETLVEA